VKVLRTNRKAAIAAILAGDVLMLLFGWFLLIGPQRATATQISNATAATEAQISEATRPIVQPAPAAVQTQPDIRTADLYSLAKAMPTDPDTPDLLLELNLLARESGVTLSSITPGAVTTSGAFNVIPVSLSIDGDFYSVTDYLYRLRTLVGVRAGQLRTAGRLYSVGEVSLSGGASAGAASDSSSSTATTAPVTASSGGSSLQATLTVNAYVWGAAASTTPSTAAPVAPPSTDTTGSTTSTTTEAPSN
jgi:hypothetical protein